MFFFQDSLHLTVTKTFMEVLTTLSQAFADAYKRNLTARDSHLAPYRIVNQTGMNVSVAVRQSGFQVRRVSNFVSKWKYMDINTCTHSMNPSLIHTYIEMN